MRDRHSLSSFGELSKMLLRWSWVILAAAFAGVALATFLATNATSYSATARLGLTEEVRWPYFNAARQRVAGIADGLDPSDVVSNPDGLVSVEVTLPPGEAFLNIEAVADDPDLATRAANEFMQQLIELDSSANTGGEPLRNSLDAAQLELDALASESTELNENYVELLARQTEAEVRWLEIRDTTASAEAKSEALAARKTLDFEVANASRRLDNLSRRLVGLEVERDQLNVQMLAETTGPQVEAIRAASPETAAAAPLRPRQVVGGLTGAILAALLIWILSENFGRLRTPAGIHAVIDAAVIDARADRGLGKLAIWAGRLGVPSTIGFMGGDEQAEQVLYMLQRNSGGVATTVVLAGEMGKSIDRKPTKSRRLINLGEPKQGQWFDRALSTCDEVVLLVPYNRYRPFALRQMSDEVVALGSRVSMAVIIPTPKRRLQRRPRMSEAESKGLAQA